MSRGNKPAYPASGRHVGADAIEYFTMGGMTLREHYAGLAMQGLLANSTTNFDAESYGQINKILFCADFSKRAVAYADTLIAELERVK